MYLNIHHEYLKLLQKLETIYKRIYCMVIYNTIPIYGMVIYCMVVWYCNLPLYGKIVKMSEKRLTKKILNFSVIGK